MLKLLSLLIIHMLPLENTSRPLLIATQIYEHGSLSALIALSLQKL